MSENLDGMMKRRRHTPIAGVASRMDLSKMSTLGTCILVTVDNIKQSGF